MIDETVLTEPLNNNELLIINPPSMEGMVVDRDSMGGFGAASKKLGKERFPSYRPLSLLYTAAVLEQAGYKVEMIDYTMSNNRPSFPVGGYNFILVLTALPSLYDDSDFARELKEYYDSFLILTGPVLKFYGKEALEISGADVAIFGEPEFLVPEILKSCQNGTALFDIPNIIFRYDKQLITTEVKEFDGDIETLPFPAWHLLPNYRLTYTVQGSKGCPYACLYCPYPVGQGRKYRSRGAESIVEEIQYLIDRFKTKHFVFRDPLFGLNRNETIKMCELMLSKDTRVKWDIEVRPELLDEELLITLRKSGCVTIKIGVESGDIDVLRTVRKGMKDDEYFSHLEKVVNIAKDLDMSVVTYFMIGLPDDTKESIWRSIKLAQQLKPDYVQFSVATPFPGTELEKIQLRGNLIVNGDISKMNSMVDCVARTRFLTADELIELHNEACSIADEIMRQRRIEKIKGESIWKLMARFVVSSNKAKIVADILRVLQRQDR